MPNFRRGEIYYIEKYSTQYGSEQSSGRPAIIVSNNKCNEFSDVLEVVYLTTQPKKDLPTHVVIRSIPKESTALCEQVTSVAKERFSDFIALASDKEMSQIDTALLISLDLTLGTPAEPKKTTGPESPLAKTDGPNWEIAFRSEKAEKERKISELEQRLIKSDAEMNVYKSLYGDLLSRAIGSAERS